MIIQDLIELYGVDRIVIKDWRRNKGLSIIEVTLLLEIHQSEGVIEVRRESEKGYFSL